MIERNKIEREIDEGMELLDAFPQPTVSSLFADYLAEEMSKRYRHDRRGRILFQIFSPVAAAAVIAVAGLLMFSSPVSTPSSNSPAVSEIESLLAEWAQLENNAYGFFADLDYQTAQVSQNSNASSTSTQPTAGSTDDEWTRSVIEAFDLDLST
jgi:hypothetical protein